MRKLNFLLLACYIGALANGYISSLISNLTPNPRYFEDIQGLSHPQLLGLVTAAQSMGCVAAFFPAPWLSDKYGCRVGIIFDNIGMIAGFTGQIFCTRFDQFLGMRILVGFSSISNTISSSTLLVDLNNTSGWLALLATPGNRKRLVLSVAIAIATQWVRNGIISFYLTPVLRTVGITNSLHQQGINGGLQIYVWLLACGAALLCEKAGRRRIFLTSTSLMLAFMVLITICSVLYSATGSASAGYAVIVFLFIFFGGYIIGLTPIPILYVNEIWPSHLRTKGTSVFSVSQAVSITFNRFVNPVAIDKIAWKYYLIYIGVLVAVINFNFFFVPETKGLSLEQISGIFNQYKELLSNCQMSDERIGHEGY
ncbi:hypothetical protein G6011_00600 [Alternaria panax]|uniref:Major facilitator superfamily (MFS) profile domain-containing protein n=1 Tax=Alternaria panax TaxID=48097 RepID=A0AAD4IJ59_9PLEO|nr:hypothetical protein G6011_00600 [Alternaria panax]